MNKPRNKRQQDEDDTARYPGLTRAIRAMENAPRIDPRKAADKAHERAKIRDAFRRRD